MFFITISNWNVSTECHTFCIAQSSGLYTVSTQPSLTSSVYNARLQQS